MPPLKRNVRVARERIKKMQAIRKGYADAHIFYGSKFPGQVTYYKNNGRTYCAIKMPPLKPFGKSRKKLRACRRNLQKAHLQNAAAKMNISCDTSMQEFDQSINSSAKSSSIRQRQLNAAGSSQVPEIKMVNTICAVSGCNKESYPGCGLTFHRLPAAAEIRQKWNEAIPGKVTNNSVLCSLHFQPEDYITEARKKLKPGIVPSIFQENYHEYAASVLASSKSPPPSAPAEPDTQSKELEMFKQIKSNLLKLRRLSESAPAPAPTLELEIFPEQEPKSEPKNETNESTSEFLDESKPPVEEEEHEEEQKHEKEEKEQEITEDPYLKEKTSRKRPIKEVKALPKKVKRNPRRQAVIRREEQEAIKAARNAPAIEKVYLNTAENVPKTTRGRKKQDKSSSETEPSLNRAERLYEFGKYVAEQLISFDDKDSETAQTEIKEVLQKYRLKYKIMKCLTKPGANVQAEAEATAKVTQINSNGHSATQSKKIDTNSVTGSKTYSRISKIVQPPDNRPVKLATASLIRQQLQKQITGPAANPMVSKPGQSTGNISIESNVPTQLKPNSAKTPKAYSKVAKNAQAKVNSPIEINIQAELASNSILQHTLQNQEPVKFVIIKTDQGLSLSTEQLIGAGKSINLQPLSIESSHPNAPLSTWPTLTIEPQLNLTQPVLPKVISTVAQPVTSLPINVASVEPNMNIPISQSDISNENENLPSLPHVMIMAPSETQPDEPDAESSGHLQVAMDEEAESITFKCEPDDSEEEN